MDFFLLPENIDLLKEIVKYHVLSDTVLSVELKDGQQVPTLQGETLDIGVDATGVTVNGFIVSSADVAANNGVIHVIDGLLTPLSFRNDATSIIDIIDEGSIIGIYSIEALAFLLDSADLVDVLDGLGSFSTCILCVSSDLLCLRSMLTTSLYTINSLKPFLSQPMMSSLPPLYTTLRRRKMWRL